MFNLETKRKIESYLENSRQLSVEDKEAIAELCAQFGVKCPQDTNRCPDCWKDTLIALRVKADEALMEEDTTRQYVLRGGIDVIWKGIRINSSTLTDENAKWWIENGFSEKYFKRLPSVEAPEPKKKSNSRTKKKTVKK